MTSSHCQHCQDGIAPQPDHVQRINRAHYVYRECGRDVTLVLTLILRMDEEFAK